MAAPTHTSHGDRAEFLDGTWTPGQWFGARFYVLSFLSFWRTRCRSELIWELLASTLLPLVSFTLLVSKELEQDRANTTGFHLLLACGALWLIAVCVRWRNHVLTTGPTARAR